MNQYIQDRLSEKKLYSKGMITLESAKKALEYSIKQQLYENKRIIYDTALTS